MYDVEVIKWPGKQDWLMCKKLALSTAGKHDKTGTVAEEWKRRMLHAQHSPIRALTFVIGMTVPYWVSVHFTRHKVGVEHFVTTQRNDRQDAYDRTSAPQDTPVRHIMLLDAQALINIARARLCGKAAPETRRAMREIRDAVLDKSPEFESVLVPKCIAHGGCVEFEPCGRHATMEQDGTKLKYHIYHDRIEARLSYAKDEPPKAFVIRGRRWVLEEDSQSKKTLTM